MTQTVGIVGIGIMGTAMTRNLRQSGFEVVGYDPVPAACSRLLEMGGRPLASPREVVAAAPITLMSLPNAEALTQAIASVVQAEGGGQIVVECSTLPLDVKQAAYLAMERSGKILLDCPVSGTGAQAVSKDLVILGSGDERAFASCAEVFAAMSRSQRYLGPFGRGSMMKYIANHLVTIHNVAAAEAMLLGIKAGLDPAVVYDTLADSAGTSRMFQLRGALMRDQSYDQPTATIRMHRKDISIIDGFAASLACALPVYAAASQLYHAGAALGFAEQDTAAVCAVLETMHGLDRKKSAS